MKSFKRGVICSDLHVLNFYSGFTVENIPRAKILNMRSCGTQTLSRSPQIQSGVHYLKWENITWPGPIKT